LGATAGRPPYSWSLASGVLPAGLTLSAAEGTIAGTPTSVGRADYQLRVTDDAGFSTTGQGVIQTYPAASRAVWAWGGSGYLVQGGSSVPVATSHPVAGVSGVTGLGTSYAVGSALLADGTVRSWGDGTAGTLGNGTNDQTIDPVPATGLTEVNALAGSSATMAALRSDGTVWAWGDGGHGSLGNGTTNSSNVPTQVSGLSDVRSIGGAGLGTLFAVKDDGTVWAWGRGDYGLFGDTKNSPAALTPVQVPGLADITAVVGGFKTAYALTSDGTVWSWGVAQNGSLGHSTSTPISAPGQVTGLTDVTEVDGGSGWAMARRADGTVWAWGSNSNGQLGGAGPAVITPAPVPGLSDVSQIAAGASVGYALRSDGTVWSWGLGFFGSLGNGVIPVPVNNPLSRVLVPPMTHLAADPTLNAAFGIGTP
jgi:alpha-tubulin suppressor-like RCC1 family protein